MNTYKFAVLALLQSTQAKPIGDSSTDLQINVEQSDEMMADLTEMLDMVYDLQGETLKRLDDNQSSSSYSGSGGYGGDGESESETPWEPSSDDGGNVIEYSEVEVSQDNYNFFQSGNETGDGPGSGCASNEDQYTIQMDDSYGDGWNGNTFCVHDQCGTIDNGSTGQFDVCLEPGCYMVNVGGGTWQEEISWTGLDMNGGAPFDEVVCVGGGEAEVEMMAPQCDTYLVTMEDSWGDGWNGNYFTVNGQSGTIANGCGNSYNEFEVCLEPGCYTVNVGGGSWQEECSWTFAGISGGAPYEHEICVGGLGDVEIEIDDVNGECDNYTVTMYDSYGDTWNGNYFEIDGQIGTMDQGSCGNRIYEKNVDICLAPGCYDFFVGGGSWQNEVSWTFAG